MKVKQYFQAYDFDEIYPEIGLMFPNGRHQRKQFQHAYDMLLEIEPVNSKKQIRYQMMKDPDTKEVFFGADDSGFKGPWKVLLGKEVKIEPSVKLTQNEIVANLLLNVVLQGRHPKAFDADYDFIVG